MTILSLIIPTRDRAEYLRYSIESATMVDFDIEIIVSDNASRDDTRSVVESFSDERIKYINTGSRVSMRQNFEFAVQSSSGDYIIIIGDDDAFIPTSVQQLIQILLVEKPRMVRWSPPLYQWPNQGADSNPHLLVTKEMMFGGYEHIASSILVSALCEGSLKSQRLMPSIYHGCVSRALMEDIRQKASHYFGAQTPDCYNSFAGMMISDRYLTIKHPVTIAGASPKSNAGNVAAHSNFFVELQSDPLVDPIDMQSGSIALVYLNTLVAAHRDVGDKAPAINWERWLSRSLSEIKSAHQSNEAQSMFIGKLRADVEALGQRLPENSLPPEKLKKQRKKIGKLLSLNRIREKFSQTSTIMDAVNIVEKTARHHVPKGNSMLFSIRREIQWYSAILRHVMR